MLLPTSRNTFRILGLLFGAGQLLAQTAQTITFDAVPAKILGTSPFAIAAQASSLLPVTFTSGTSAVCTTASNLVTLLSAGTCTITASQAGNAGFSAATPVMRSFSVNRANPSGTLIPATASPFKVGTAPQMVATGDFNADGFPDLAVVNNSDNTVTVLLGDGKGGFAPATHSPFAVGNSPVAVVVGDFNGDGSQDLAVSNFADNTVTILLGNGSANFTPAANSPVATGSGPAFLAVGDFNSDGIQDLAVPNFHDGTVTVLVGNGAGRFTAAGTPLTVGTSPGTVVVGDFNRDGFQDLAVANSGSSTVTVLMGNGAAVFTAATGSPFTTGAGAFSLVVGDFNGDGFLDIATANNNGNNVTVLLGKGNGNFNEVTGSPFAVGAAPISISAADFNGDGITDLAVANATDATVTILLGTVSGTFTASPGGVYSVGTGVTYVLAADLNGDGIQDLATSNGTANSVTVLLGGKAATTSVLTTTSALAIPAGQTVPLTLTVSDVPPAFSAPTGTATFLDGTTVLGTATQTTSPYTFTTAGLALGPHTLSATYGGDKFTAASTSNTITIQVGMAQTITFAALSNMTFGTAPFALHATSSSMLTVSFASTTTNVCTVSMTNMVTLLTGGTCSITASQAGNSTYAPAPPVTQSFTVTNAPQTITFDSIRSQILGTPPFAIAAQSSSGLTVALASTTPAVCATAELLVTIKTAGSCSIAATQPGNAGFNAATMVTRTFTVKQAKPSTGLAQTSTSLTAGTGPAFVVTGDFNGDGVPDLAVANGTGNNVTVLIGDGMGGFTASTGSPFAVGSNPVYIAVGDFNGDGKQDLAVANLNDNTVTILLGDGMGGFAPATASPITAGTGPDSVAIGDFNGDGIQDLAVSNFTSSGVTILLGNGQGGFAATIGSPLTVGTNPGAVTTADFNGDGFLDLAIANFHDNTVTVLLGNGSGVFTPPMGSPFAAGTGAFYISAGDFNGDGFQDLAIANYNGNNVTVLLGNGMGGFTAATGSPIGVGTNPGSLVVSDLNGDGIPDLAVTNFTDGTVSVLKGSSTGTFTALTNSPFSARAQPDSVTAADFNGDGITDLVVANRGGGLTVLLGVGTTAQTITFGPLGNVQLGVGPFNISATSSSGLTVTLTSTTTAVCTVANSAITVLSTGVCSITASQPGNTMYAAATPVTQSFTISSPPPPPPPIIPVGPAPLSITTLPSLPEIALGSPVSATLAATGGVPPYTWSNMSIPAGYTLDSVTGALSGLPTQAGNISFTAIVTDSAIPVDIASLTVTVPVLGMTTAPSLPGGLVGKGYSITLGALGGLGGYAFSSTNLPAGLSISGNTLSGIPTTAGTFSFPIQVADGSGIVASTTYKLVVAPALSLSASGATSEIAFGASAMGSLTAIGGKPPYAFAAANLPPGVTVNATTGALGGSPSQPGNYNFTVQVADSESPPVVKTLPLTLQVLGVTTPSMLPAGSTLSAYSQVFTAAGGAGPYAFSSTGLPAGLSFSGTSLSGTPSIVGSYSFAVRVTDGNGFSTSSYFNMIVTGPGSPLSITGGSLTGGSINNPYSQFLSGTGGAPPYTWTVIGGALPSGLSLNGPNGSLSGTPLTPGSYVFTAQATDSLGVTSSGVFTITVAPQPLVVSGIPFPNGIVGSDYPIQVLTGLGGIGPYTFSISSGSLPAGLTLANGVISGFATGVGTANFTIAMADSESPPLTTSAPAQILIASPGKANLILSAGSLSFNVAAGASGVSEPALVAVQSSDPTMPLKYSVTPTPAASWLNVKSSGNTPGNIGVSLDPSAANLSASSAPLTTSLVVTCLAPSPCVGTSQTIAVSLSITVPPPQLLFTTNLVQFSATGSRQVGIQNVGGGSAVINSVTPADTWLMVTGVPTSVQAGAPVYLTFTANAAGLATGFYRTTVTIQSSAGIVSVPVTLNIASATVLTLSSYGAQFQSTLGSPPINTAGSFQIGSTSATAVNWTASVLPGASWIRLNQFTTSGTASSSTPGTVNYTIDPTVATQPQAYYGIVQIAAPTQSNAPLNYLVVLNVAGAMALPVPELQPGGLLFVTGSQSTPPAQNITVYSNSGNGTAYAASAGTTDGGTWLTVSPASGTSSAASAVVAKVSVNPGVMPPGVYTGTVSFQFLAAKVRSVNVTMIVTPGGCSSTQLVASPTGLGNNFAQSAGWPAPLSFAVTDNCGAPVSNGQVTVAFSNGDPPVSLTVSPGTGIYSGTWTPIAASGEVTVTATASAPGLASAAASVIGEVLPNAVPLLTPGGTLHVFNPLIGGALGQGTILQIYGSNFSPSTTVGTAVPLATALGGTSVTVGGIAAPLYYVSPGQIDAQLPYELVPGNTYQAIVNNNGALSMPISVVATAATPGVAAFASGLVIAQHPNGTLVSESAPAAPGEYIVIYLSGLGQTNHTVADGAAAPNNPLSNPLVAPTLTLNGTGIPISFAGLTPSAVGLYQINFQVPANTPNGDLQLVVSQAGVTDNPVILPVHK